MLAVGCLEELSIYKFMYVWGGVFIYFWVICTNLISTGDDLKKEDVTILNVTDEQVIRVEEKTKGGGTNENIYLI
jgi:hypothetical protein